MHAVQRILHMPFSLGSLVRLRLFAAFNLGMHGAHTAHYPAHFQPSTGHALLKLPLSVPPIQPRPKPRSRPLPVR
jgi:hypothetical protein